MVSSALQLFPITLGGPPGVVKDRPAYLIPSGAYQHMENARILNGTLRKSVGWTEFSSDDMTNRVMRIEQFFKTDGSEYLVFYTTAGTFKYNTTTGNFDDITGVAFTGDADDLFSVDVGFDLIVACNDKDAVRKWTGTGTEAVLAGLTDVQFLDGTAPIVVTTAACIRYFKNFLVLLNVTENGTRKPSRVRWSRLGLPENWKNTAAGAGQAGAADVGDVDWCLTAERLGDTLVIYKERSIWLMTYIGPPTIMSFREKVGGVGLVGPMAVGNLGDEHMVVAQDDIYFFNGETIESVGDPVRKYFFDNADPSEIGKTQIFILEEENEAIIAFVSTASSNAIYDKGIVYNYLEKTWSLRDLDATAFGYYRKTDDLTWDAATGTLDNPGEPGTWDDRRFLDNAPINLFGNNTGFVYTFEGVSLDGAAQTMLVRTKLYDMGDPNRYKRVQRLQILANRESTPVILKIRIGVSENMDDDPAWGDWQEFDLNDTANPFLDVDVTGRFFTFEIKQDGIDEDCKLTGMIVHFLTKGVK